MNSVAQIAEANAQIIFEKIEDHILTLTEFSSFLSQNMYGYLFEVYDFNF